MNAVTFLSLFVALCSAAVIRTPDYEVVDGEDGFGLVNEIVSDIDPSHIEPVSESVVDSIVASKPLAILNRKIGLLEGRIAFADNSLRTRAAIQSDILSLTKNEDKKDFLSAQEEKLRASYLVSRSTKNVDVAYRIFEAQVPLDRALRLARAHMAEIQKYLQIDELSWREYMRGQRFETGVVDGMLKYRELLTKEEKNLNGLGKALSAAVRDGMDGLDKSVVSYVKSLMVGA